VRDAAYGTLLKSRRRQLHQRIAHTLEEHFPDTVKSAPELLAHHCTEAGLIEPAVRYWRKAGKRAIERSANVEAIAQLSRGLELAKTLPATPERLTEEVRLQVSLISPLIATKGYTALEVEKASNRALELCQQLGEAPELFTVLGNLNSIYFNRGQLEIALDLAKRMLRLAESRRDPALLLWGHYALGFTLASQGVLKAARRHLGQSVTFYNARKGDTDGYVQNPGPTALALLSIVIYLLGYPDQARMSMQRAVAMARDLSHPFTLAWVLGIAGELNWRLGEKLAAQGFWEECVALSTEQGFKQLLASACVWLGFALVEQGDGEEGIAKMDRALYGMTDSLSIGVQLRGLHLLALAQGKVGHADRGLAKIDEALALLKDKKSGHATPGPSGLGLAGPAGGDLYLAKAQLILINDARSLRKAQQCLRSAIRIARQQSAKSDELAAVILLARLLASPGRRDEARTMLGAIYGWFTEGFDTAELKEAKALLDELSG
jgi:tetratricopeptide (TPR) repeat protein